jgi:hypothetical protein
MNGENNLMFERIHTIELLIKISKIKKEKSLSIETKTKLS